MEEVSEEKKEENLQLSGALTEISERKSKEKSDDVTAFQTVLCILLAVGIIVLNQFYPKTAEGLLIELKKSIVDTSAVTIPNPIDVIINFLVHIKNT